MRSTPTTRSRKRPQADFGSRPARFVRTWNRVSWLQRAPVLFAARRQLGRTFDQLTLFRHVVDRRVPQFWCRCTCGNEVVLTLRELEVGRARSCGHCRRWSGKTDPSPGITRAARRGGELLSRAAYAAELRDRREKASRTR